MEVMREPEPTKHPLEVAPRTLKGWQRGSYSPQFGAPIEWYWKPKPFSEDLDHAMSAVDKYLDDAGYKFLRIGYERGQELPWSSWFDGGLKGWGDGNSAPEAICNLLLESSDRSDGRGERG